MQARAHATRIMMVLISASALVGCGGESLSGNEVVSPDASSPEADAEPEAGCSTPKTDCGGVCVDTSTDTENCGGCGRACPATEQCNHGECTAVPGDFGQPCTADDECAAGLCLPSGICSKPCSGPAECPSGPEWTCAVQAGGQALCSCSPSAASEICVDSRDNDCNGVIDDSCSSALAVAAIVPGDLSLPAEDGMTMSHVVGLEIAAGSAPYLQFGSKKYEIVDKKTTFDEVSAAIDAEASKGAGVIITTTEQGNSAAMISAPKYPHVRFLMMGSRRYDGFNNVGGYYPASDQLWYASGKLAAREANAGTRCIGLVLPVPSRQIVRDTNAFTRGVLSADPATKVVIRWVGASKDVQPEYDYKAAHYQFDSAVDGKLYREELLTAQLADLGCTLIAHRTDTQRVVSFVERIAPRVNAAKQDPANRNLFSMGVDARDSCKENAVAGGTWIPSCLGTPYWNWGPAYTQQFDLMYKEAWQSGVTELMFHVGPTSVMRFEINPNPALTGVPVIDAAVIVSEVADAGPDAVFLGPYSFNGQRDLDLDGKPDTNQSVPGGMPLASEELDRMCWFVQGVYELADWQQVSMGSLIPAMVPYGPGIPGQVTTVDATTESKSKYGDVFTFVSGKTGKAPAEVMSCPLN